jgi:ElaB/YqjD/DUF883 family membrane-anchored ribosome-binding protein
MSERKMEKTMKNEGHSSMGNMIHDAKDKVDDFIRSEKIDEKLVRAKNLVQEGMSSLSHVYDDSVATASRGIRARPMASLAIAFAAGVAAVAVTRSLRKSKHA